MRLLPEEAAVIIGWTVTAAVAVVLVVWERENDRRGER